MCAKNGGLVISKMRDVGMTRRSGLRPRGSISHLFFVPIYQAYTKTDHAVQVLLCQVTSANVDSSEDSHEANNNVNVYVEMANMGIQCQCNINAMSE